MAFPPSIGHRQILKSAVRGLGVVVALALIGALGGAFASPQVTDPVTGISGSGALIHNIGSLKALEGAMLAAGAGGFALTASAFSGGLRRKLITIFRRSGRLLTFLAALGCFSVACSALFIMVERQIPDQKALLGVMDAYLVHVPHIARDALYLLMAAIAWIIPCITWGVAGGVELGLACGLVGLACLAAVVLARVAAGFLRSGLRKPERAPEDLSGGTGTPWPIRAAVAFMPPEAGRRWGDAFNEACHDYDEDQHAKLLHDFLLHAPAVITRAWLVALDDVVIISGLKRR